MSAVRTVEKKRAEAPATEGLSQRTILRFFSPLALSWIFMSVEGPLSVALISRLPNAEISTAAFQIMMGLALWIESPIIDLLSTSTTLAKTRQNYVQLSRFTWWLIATVTLVHAIIAFTPAYWFVTRNLMGVPGAVAEQGRIGLAAMVPWAGLIGWRRYLQGILIRNGRTKLIGLGTAVRVATMFVSAFTLYWTVRLPSIEIAGIALVCAVGAEAGFAHWASRGTIREQFSEPLFEDSPIEPGQGRALSLSRTNHRDSERGEVSVAKLCRFHLPLTATTMVMMAGSPVVSSALSHAPNRVAQLAGYQVAATLVWLMRTTVFALPEVVITLYKDKASAAALRRFCIRLGFITSGTMAAIWLTGVDELFFSKVLTAPASLIPIAHLAFIACLMLPFVGACQSYVRGMLTAHHLTVSRLLAVSVSMTTLVTTLVAAHFLGFEGVVAVGICPTLALIAELGVLVYAWRVRPVVAAGLP
ncbi:MAG: hypothetical protein ACHQ50_15320 [Fimbriimonadales bacterium]